MGIQFGVIVGTIIAVLTWLPAQAGVPRSHYEGVWINPDQTKHVLIKLIITSDDDYYNIQAWENCNPNECYWGWANLRWFAPTITSRDYTHAFAKWDNGLTENYMLIQMEGDKLRIQTINLFRGVRYGQESPGHSDLYLFQRQ